MIITSGNIKIMVTIADYEQIASDLSEILAVSAGYVMTGYCIRKSDSIVHIFCGMWYKEAWTSNSFR